jgi:hypothetical protein
LYRFNNPLVFPKLSVRNGTDLIRGMSYYVPMNETQERWKQLCAQAAVEHDTTKLLTLIDEISGLLQAKDDLITARRRDVPVRDRLSVQGAAPLPLLTF